MKRRALLQFLSLTPLIALFKPRIESPKELPGLVGWCKKGEGIHDLGNGFVMWADQSGNGNHLYGDADMWRYDL